MASRMLLRGGCVLSADPKTPNLRQGDVLVEEGRIAEVGVGLRARDAEVVDATDTVVMPGFVDAHRFTWHSLLRGIGDRPGDPVAGYDAEDAYAATLVSLLGAAEAGITTVADWCPGGPAVIEAVLEAHADSGLRTVLVCAGGDEAFAAAAASPLTTPAAGTEDPGRLEQTLAAARPRGLRTHGRTGPGWKGKVAALRSVLGPDLTLIHCADLDDTDLDAAAATSTLAALAPAAEMAEGRALPPIQRLLDRGIRPGLGVGAGRVAPGDLFAQMRSLISLQHATYFDLKLAGKAGLPNLLNTREVLRSATSDGATALGLASLTGSLRPGMQADLIVLRTDRPNIAPVNDPIGAVVWGMDTSNVDLVLVAGRAVVRGGVLQTDLARVRALAVAARDRVAIASGRPA